MAPVLFWSAAFLIFYAYFGYSILLLLWPWKKPVARGRIEPRISVLIAARNEATAIAEKVRHTLALEYPADRIEIVVVSDGSSDKTVEEMDSFRSFPNVKVVAYAPARGKAYALNMAASEATGEVLVFNDVRQRLAPGALRTLLANFADPAVGCVSGELHFYNERQPGIKATLYWKYERWMRRMESLIGACMGATGAFYAIRRECFRALPEGLILDDVYTPLQIALRGYRVIHESEAVVFDVEAHTEKHEFQRKVRTLTGNYQLLRILPGLMRLSRIGFQFFSHKAIRLAVPVLLPVCFFSSLFAGSPFYQGAFAAQAAGYAAAAFGIWRGRKAPFWAMIPASIVILNSAALVALFNFLRGKTAVWQK